ncbi:magnesium transporter CorA family protein [Sporolactobacillus terrae]|uniref:Magnesium transporter n=1 Tax=Sporolactobacillus terrae TaxID=269673 RepID=A0A410D7G0_9BACL|nr:magnesium transporter CorA family protein [Sporolactobacillus terrae]QAA21991.1 magnesium transporter CorA family protein [Sporolactobacillus terrae]QAA24964.1 magnesium transporter CorA family protein [Sporolactobacillus terrae]UAK16788.1 magnesium transporter CorA family protein [Sporolactobacillus terrae]BBN98274.1 magnesium transporter [Sporolactobacillus terrae]
MIDIYLTDEQDRLIKKDELTKGCWINLTRPSEFEIQKVVEGTGISSDFIRDSLDDDERSRIEKEDDSILIIVDFPVLIQDESDSAPYDTIPLGIIVTPYYFVTVCLQSNPIIDDFVNNRIRNFFTYKKTRFTLQILYVIARYYLKYLKTIDRRTSMIERELHESMRNKELFDLLSLEKTLVYFTTSLKSNNIVMEKMTKQRFLRMYEDDQDLLEDVIIEIKQAIEMSEVHSNILSGMMDAYASVISNNVNVVMKFLTTVTIVLSIPTMVASFWGMNVSGIPWEHVTHGFWIPITLAIGLAGITALFFWKKKYF